MSLSYLLADDHTTMLNIIEKILCHFESCFSRKASFGWFVTILNSAKNYNEANDFRLNLP